MADESPIEVQEIMLQIEQKIWADSDDQEKLWMPDLDSELRVHLIRLREMAGGLQLEVPVTPPGSIPLVSPLIALWRKKLHQLVLFYINSFTRYQVAFAQTLTRTVIYLAERYEAENKALQAQVEELRRELAEVRAADPEE